MAMPAEESSSDTGLQDRDREADRQTTVDEKRGDADSVYPAEKEVERLVSTKVRSFFRATYSGPLPPPELLRSYEETLPGAAERIFTVFESQSEHRRALEREQLANAMRSEGRGQWMAFVITLVALLIGGALLYAGKNITGLAAILGSLATLVAVFAVAKKQGQRELAEKRTEVTQPEIPEDSAETTASEP